MFGSSGNSILDLKSSKRILFFFELRIIFNYFSRQNACLNTLDYISITLVRNVEDYKNPDIVLNLHLSQVH